MDTTPGPSVGRPVGPADAARLVEELGPELTSRIQRWKDRYNAEEQASLLELSDQEARRGLFVRYLIVQNRISEGV